MPAINLAQLAKLFKQGGVGEQLVVWGLLQQLMTAVLAPEMEMLTRGVNSVLQSTPLSPADLADMVNRAIISHADAEAYAKQSGVAPSDFQRLVAQAGDALSPQEAVLALRRGLIPRHGRGPDAISFEQAIAESRIKDKWTPTVEALGAQPLPVADAVDAVVESQISHEQGVEWANRSGIDPDVFQILVDTRGNPPSPTQLLELFRRGIIPMDGLGPDAVSVRQGIYEGATKNKWFGPLVALSDYVVPPRTVTAMVREGSLTDPQALAEFRKSGLTQQLATAYLDSAHHQKLAATKDLAKGIVDQLYHDQVFSADQADQAYGLLGYTAVEAGFLRLVQDLKRSVTAQTQAISRIRSEFVNHRIDRGTASNALDKVQVPASQRDQLLGDWDVEVAINVKVVSAAEIATAMVDQIIDVPTAFAMLQQQGYDYANAWILLSVRAKQPLPNPPATIGGSPGGQ